jgi:hypothetical protein
MNGSTYVAFDKSLSRALQPLVLIACACPGRPASAQETQLPIRLTVNCQNSQQLTLAIQNAGTSDTAVIFGHVLGNGGKYVIDELTLQVDFSDGQASAGYVFSPSEYPVRNPGRLDDWIVPLPAGVSYLVPAMASQFRTRLFGRLSEWPKGATMTLKLPLRAPSAQQNPDLVGLKLLKVWTGTDALVSNRITFPTTCGD